MQIALTNLKTLRLDLTLATAELTRLEAEDRALFHELLCAHVPGNWPPDNLAYVLTFFLDESKGTNALNGWHSWYWILRENWMRRAVLVGCGGYKVDATNSRRVELAASILPCYRNYGFATESLSAMVQYIFATTQINHITAEIMAENYSSLRLVEKLNFSQVTTDEEVGVLRFELFRRNFYFKERI